tara:strand:+ start:83 stop:277 length:195 start_codon:yes stop_codon:yes gene_type:complete
MPNIFSWVGLVGIVELVVAGDQQNGTGDQGSEGAHGEAAAEHEQRDLDASIRLPGARRRRGVCI